MPSVQLRTRPLPEVNGPSTDPLPTLLQTPSGLAILEMQGTIHGPFPHADETVTEVQTIDVGRLEFPLYNTKEPLEGKWMKKVYLYVGKHQRLTGEIKKLAKPLAVIQKVNPEDEVNGTPTATSTNEDLEVLEIVKYKLLFSGRPEPVGE
ncbi:uncharacterized protein PV06_08445 [Exophiala oligosperma]|uniref:Chromosome transmission fidelity protein 8 n=2 Tax=Chaetothyriales TaxID=34395 RepID=A0A0D2D9S9_9EURO|nr:uncharacterized protein PV06_08445 [Exophiala oligosperma]KIW39873.1 hypothetical protein PV06_08445 [Exophiala oligosperma]